MSKAVVAQTEATHKTDWREHPKHAGYRVSADGRVQTRWWNGGGRVVLTETWREMKIQTLPSGYRFITINKHASGTGKRLNRYIHHLVLELFVGPRPEGQDGLHGDGDNSNNRVENLRWGTPVENAADKKRHGTDAKGSEHGIAKLNEASVVAILGLLATTDLSLKKIGARHGVSAQTVVNIRNGKIWKHVTRPLELERKS